MQLRVVRHIPEDSDWLWAARPSGWSSSPGRVNNILHVVETGSGAHPASYPMGAGGSFRGVKRQRPDATHLQLAPRSRKRGSIHPLSHTSSWRSA
jgi:hypothetical protein